MGSPAYLKLCAGTVYFFLEAQYIYFSLLADFNIVLWAHQLFKGHYPSIHTIIYIQYSLVFLFVPSTCIQLFYSHMGHKPATNTRSELWRDAPTRSPAFADELMRTIKVFRIPRLTRRLPWILATYPSLPCGSKNYRSPPYRG